MAEAAAGIVRGPGGRTGMSGESGDKCGTYGNHHDMDRMDICGYYGMDLGKNF